MLKIVTLSDTHNRHNSISLPPADMAIHSGDALGHGTEEEFINFIKWYGNLPYKYKLYTPGNHDWFPALQPEKAKQLADENNVIMLIDQEVTIEGIKIYGSPWQPEFCNWAYNLPRGEELAEVWAKIPDDTNILVTHGPPHGILDKLDKYGSQPGEHVGCEDLYKRVTQLKQLKYHIFGHIHCGYGYLPVGNTTFINAAICTERYRADNPPFIIEYGKNIQVHF